MLYVCYIVFSANCFVKVLGIKENLKGIIGFVRDMLRNSFRVSTLSRGNNSLCYHPFELYLNLFFGFDGMFGSTLILYPLACCQFYPKTLGKHF